ncbi:hypothetical protein Chor_014815 [Crotalus horridus]
MEGRDWDRRALPVCAGAVLATTLVAEVLLVLLRFRPPGQPFPLWPIASLLFLLASALENARRFIMASPSTRGVMLAGAGQGWDYCYSCQTHVPSRCSHCFSCNVCVLRRDHHCLLLGQCVGYQNYRYFLCLLLYGFLLFHSLLALRGQTTKEWFEGNRQYHLGWRENLRQVMGDRWLLAFLTPFVGSPLPGDGITFQTRSPKTEELSTSRSY